MVSEAPTSEYIPAYDICDAATELSSMSRMALTQWLLLKILRPW
jgi:hypothetical protein